MGIDNCTSNKKIWVPFLCWPKNVSGIKRSSHDLFIAIKASRWDSTTASPRISDKESWPACLHYRIYPSKYTQNSMFIRSEKYIYRSSRKEVNDLSFGSEVTKEYKISILKVNELGVPTDYSAMKIEPRKGNESSSRINLIHALFFAHDKISRSIISKYFSNNFINLFCCKQNHVS